MAMPAANVKIEFLNLKIAAKSPAAGLPAAPEQISKPDNRRFRGRSRPIRLRRRLI
jgi:hypothetical protein